MKKIYLDYAASTPVAPEVAKAMAPYFGEHFGNPSSLHHFGQKTSGAVFGARRSVAKALGAGPEDIIFTGSATEANNLALRGLVKGLRFKVKNVGRPRIITSAIEHESVLETCRDLERDGVEVIYLPVDKNGFVDLKKFKAALNDRTILVSVMHANNEVGTIQPIIEIAGILRNFRNSKYEILNSKQSQNIKSNNKSNKVSDLEFRISNLEAALPLLHTDAAQSFQYLDCRPAELGIDLMTLSAHKIYGPKGVGALYANKAAREVMRPVVAGSGQENGLRSGTENVPGVVGFGKAVEVAGKIREKEAARVLDLRDYFWKELRTKLRNKVAINGSLDDRLPNNLNIYFPGHNAHDLLIRFDLLGVSVSPGAACSTRVSQASYVLEAMGFPPDRASGSLRFSLGRQTKKSDIDYVISVIMKVLG